VAERSSESASKSHSHWRSETQRLQWEMTERALDKNDDGMFKKMGSKMKGMKDK
jgi:hypothetical protein